VTVEALVPVAATSAAVVIAALLLRASLEKFTDLGATAATVSALGVPARWAGLAAGFVAISEVAAALGVLFAPHSRWTQAGVVALGGAFALAGLVAVLRKERIRCNCFGSGAAGAFLGPAQILALPAWLGAALILHYGVRQNPALATGALLFAAAGLAITTLKVPALWRAVREARGDRISAQEMYAWLPPR
jgi:hypothetical protein